MITHARLPYQRDGGRCPITLAFSFTAYGSVCRYYLLSSFWRLWKESSQEFPSREGVRARVPACIAEPLTREGVLRRSFRHSRRHDGWWLASSLRRRAAPPLSPRTWNSKRPGVLAAAAAADSVAIARRDGRHRTAPNLIALAMIALMRLAWAACHHRREDSIARGILVK